MNQDWVGATYMLLVVAAVWGLLKLIPAVLLSQWAEDRARENAIKARSHWMAIVAARQAHSIVITASNDISKEVDEVRTSITGQPCLNSYRSNKFN